MSKFVFLGLLAIILLSGCLEYPLGEDSIDDRLSDLEENQPQPVKEEPKLRECIKWEDINRLEKSTTLVESHCRYVEENGFLKPIYFTEENYDWICSVTLEVNSEIVEQYKSDCLSGKLLNEGRQHCTTFYVHEEKIIKEKLCTCWSDEPCAEQSPENEYDNLCKSFCKYLDWPAGEADGYEECRCFGRPFDENTNEYIYEGWQGPACWHQGCSNPPTLCRGYCE